MLIIQKKLKNKASLMCFVHDELFICKGKNRRLGECLCIKRAKLVILKLPKKLINLNLYSWDLKFNGLKEILVCFCV